MDITVKYEPTPGEVVRVFSRLIRRQLAILYALVVTPLLVGAVVFLFTGDTKLGIALLVAMVLVPAAVNWWFRKRARQQLAFLCVPTTLRVTEEGYEARTEENTSAMRWSMVSQVATTPEFWLLFVNGQPAAFLPKGAFDGDQQAQIDGFLSARKSAGVGGGQGGGR